MSSSTPAKKATKPKKPSTHAPYSQMIIKAITALADKKGSSRQAVSKYVRANNTIVATDAAHNSRMRINFKKLVDNGTLVANKGSFKLSAKKAAAKKSAKKPTVKKTPKKPKAKSTTPKKPAKKPAAKKSGEKKTAKKLVAKKPAAKKPAAKKPASKKAAAKKPAAKKPAKK